MKQGRKIAATYTDGDHTYDEIYEIPAGREAVETVLSSPITEGLVDGYGRSDFRWFHLPNGDWILGVWPYGDTYMSTEVDREYEV